MNHHALTVNVLLAIGNLISEFLLTDQGFTIRLQSDSKVPFLFSYTYHLHIACFQVNFKPSS